MTVTEWVDAYLVVVVVCIAFLLGVLLTYQVLTRQHRIDMARAIAHMRLNSRLLARGLENVRQDVELLPEPEWHATVPRRDLSQL